MFGVIHRMNRFAGMVVLVLVVSLVFLAGVAGVNAKNVYNIHSDVENGTSDAGDSDSVGGAPNASMTTETATVTASISESTRWAELSVITYQFLRIVFVKG